MPRGFVTVTKSSFIVSATSASLEIIVSSSIKTILFFVCNLSEKNGFTVFQISLKCQGYCNNFFFPFEVS